MRVLIADDHRLVGDALGEYLKNLDQEIEVVRAETLSEAIDRVAESDQVDLVLLDLKMPGMNGLEGLTLLRSHAPDVRVVMLSGYLDPAVVAKALESGVAGFIPKDLSGSAMLKVLELVLAGETYVPSSLVGGRNADGAGADQRGKDSVEPHGPLTRLTAREVQVLSLVIQGHSNKEIARDLGIKAVTAAFHVKGVCTKLGVSNRTQAVATALKLGWQETGGQQI